MTKLRQKNKSRAQKAAALEIIPLAPVWVLHKTRCEVNDVIDVNSFNGIKDVNNFTNANNND